MGIARNGQEKEVRMSDKTVHTWKADPVYECLLEDLRRAKIEKSESERVRAGLILLAKEHGLKIPAPVEKSGEQHGINNRKN